MLVAHVAHKPPDAPQAAVLLPTAQLPDDAQQPPLHGWLALHEVVHMWTLRSHA